MSGSAARSARHAVATSALASLALLAGAASAEEVPRPSIAAPLAEQTTLVDITRAGDGFVAVGQRGHILRSEDGRRWQQVIAPHNAMLTRVRFRSADQGWAVGYDSTILVTADGGRSWTLQHWDPEGRALYDILFLSGGRLAAIGGYGTYLQSDDDGATWTEGDNPLVDLGYHLNAGTQLADGTAVIVGERSLMARSKDNGDSWDLLDSPYEGSLFGLLPVDAHGVLVYGMRGNAYVADDARLARTMDPDDFDPFEKQTVEDAEEVAAMGWRQLDTPTTESLFGGSLHRGRALLVGVNGTALRADPAGGAMKLLATPADETLGDVIWTGDQWVAVGRRGVQPLGDMGWK